MLAAAAVSPACSEMHSVAVSAARLVRLSSLFVLLVMQSCTCAPVQHVSHACLDYQMQCIACWSSTLVVMGVSGHLMLPATMQRSIAAWPMPGVVRRR